MTAKGAKMTPWAALFPAPLIDGSTAGRLAGPVGAKQACLAASHPLSCERLGATRARLHNGARRWLASLVARYLGGAPLCSRAAGLAQPPGRAIQNPLHSARSRELVRL